MIWDPWCRHSTIERRSSRTSLLADYKMHFGYESGTIDCNSRESLTSLVFSDWSPTSGRLIAWHYLVLDTTSYHLAHLIPNTKVQPLVWKAVYVTSSRTNCNWNNVDSNYAIQMWHLLPPLLGTPIQVVRWALIGFFGFARHSDRGKLLFPSSSCSLQALILLFSSYSRCSLLILGDLSPCSSHSSCSPRHTSLTEL